MHRQSNIDNQILTCKHIDNTKTTFNLFIFSLLTSGRSGCRPDIYTNKLKNTRNNNHFRLPEHRQDRRGTGSRLDL